jgi:hypothetical protein
LAITTVVCRRNCRSESYLTLHHNRVDPTSELVADRVKCADQAKAKRGMQADGGDVGAISNDRDQLAARALLAACDESCQQLAANAATTDVLGDVHGILRREPVRRSRPIHAGVGVTHHAAVHCGNQIGQPSLENGGASLTQIVDRRRYLFERGEAANNIVRVDVLNRSQVRIGGVAQIDHVRRCRIHIRSVEHVDMISKGLLFYACHNQFFVRP